MRRKTLSAIISLLLLLAVSVLGIWLGTAKLGLADALLALFGVESGGNSVVIVRELRLPRLLGAIIAGAALAVSGLLLQCATGNNLAAPNIIGINSGAGLFVMLVLCLLPGCFWLLPVSAFVGAMLSALTVLGLSGRRGRRMSRLTVILAGVAVGALMNAGISFLSLLFPDALVSYASFSVGGFSGVYMEDIAIPGIIIAVFLVISYFLTPALNRLALGDDIASAMGVNVTRLRVFAIICAAALASAAVSFAGLIGFVGLIVPHIARRLGGTDNRVIMPLTAVLGGVLVSAADIVGRVLFSPTELTSGILISAIGAPFFLFLLILGKGGKNDDRA